MSSNEEQKVIFACFPHADDEISCVGTLANHVARGDRVVLCFATHGEMTSLMGDVPIEDIILAREEHAAKVGRIIGCEVMFLDFQDTEVEITRQNAKKLAGVISQIKPDIIITWNSYHRHPDHRSIAQLLIDAVQMARIPRIVSPNGPHRKDICILQYFDERALLPSVYVDVSESIDKVKAVTECYAETYGWEGAVENVLARRRAFGLDCDVQYAEHFTILRRRQKAVKYVC
ncbi:MAG: PIG-L family deacetylase [Asgard group archaeon]|nr:PIG-L family deacetylase [Asgard group archaeon]